MSGYSDAMVGVLSIPTFIKEQEYRNGFLEYVLLHKNDFTTDGIFYYQGMKDYVDRKVNMHLYFNNSVYTNGVQEAQENKKRLDKIEV